MVPSNIVVVANLEDLARLRWPCDASPDNFALELDPLRHAHPLVNAQAQERAEGYLACGRTLRKTSEPHSSLPGAFGLAC